MKNKTYQIRTAVWIYPGENANWHFVTVPKAESAEIRERFAEVRRGWGSIPVTAIVGNTCWDTSIFPDKRSNAYLLPMKAEVRKREGIVSGDVVVLKLCIRS